MKFNALIILCFLVIGCGKGSKKGSTGGNYTVTSEGTPFNYVMAAKNCSVDYINNDPMVKVFTDGKYQPQVVNNLDHKTIDKSLTLGGEFEINIGRITQLFQIKEPTGFSYCVSEEVSKNEKLYENAALSILHPLRDFSEKFSSLLWHLDIPEVKIQVLPRYSRVTMRKEKRKRIREKSYLINNAMYFGSQDTLIFLPQGKHKGFPVPFGKVPLWKSPAVVMHEYSHHIFKHVVIKKNKDINSFGDTGLCMDTRDFSTTKQASSGLDKRRKRVKEDMLSAINEGFADLFAFYTAGEKKFFKKMGCMSHTRDLQSSRFLSYRPKAITQEALDEFLDENDRLHLTCDYSVDFQDPHMIGAVLAHGFYTLLESSRLSSYYKLQATLMWLKDLRSDFDNSSSPEELLKMTVESFYKRIDKYTGGTKLNCEGYSKVFPVVDLKC